MMAPLASDEPCPTPSDAPFYDKMQELFRLIDALQGERQADVALICMMHAVSMVMRNLPPDRVPQGLACLQEVLSTIPGIETRRVNASKPGRPPGPLN